MNITVHRGKLQKTLGFLERLTSKNTTLPILSNILLKTDAGRVKLAATNLELGVTAHIGAKITTSGQVAIPARVLVDFIRTVRGETVTLSLKQRTLTVEAGSYRTAILCFDATEYPIIPRAGGINVHHIASSDLFHLFSCVADSIATTDSRPELAGAFLQFGQKKIIAAATDSYRLAECEVVAQGEGSSSVIIPRATIGELLHILPDITGDVTIQIGDNQIAFTHEDVEIISRLIDGRYPDYKKVIPEKNLSKTLVRKDDLENATKVAALFSSSISDIKLECTGKGVRVTGKNSNKGEAQAEIEANLKGDPFEISVNYHYLLDGLRAIPSEKMILEFTGKGSPFVLRPSGEQDRFVYLIMPLRG